MTALIVVVSVIGTLFLVSAGFFGYKLYKLDKTVALMGDYILMKASQGDNIEMPMDIPVRKSMQSDFNFPNSEGGF